MAPANRSNDPADESLLASLRRRGFIIDQSEGVQRYLSARRANAATFLQDDLLLRRDPRRIEVLEEYLHNVQRRIGLTDRLTPWQMELHVKRFMVRHARILGLSNSDVEWIEGWLATAEDT